MNRETVVYRRAPYWGGPGGTRNVMVTRKKLTYKRKRFVRGRDRTIGNYKRFGGLGLIRPEQKFLDNDLVDADVSGTSSVISSLNVIPQGISSSERIGRKCTITKLNVRMQLYPLGQLLGVALYDSIVVRVIIFIDKQTNGAAALGSDILTDTTDWMSYRRLSNVDRFTFLLDRTDVINFANFGYDVVNSLFVQDGGGYFMKWKKTMSLPIEFSGVTGAITEIKSNNIGILLIAKTAGRVAMVGKSRIRYTDF